MYFITLNSFSVPLLFAELRCEKGELSCIFGRYSIVFGILGYVPLHLSAAGPVGSSGRSVHLRSGTPLAGCRLGILLLLQYIHNAFVFQNRHYILILTFQGIKVTLLVQPTRWWWLLVKLSFSWTDSWKETLWIIQGKKKETWYPIREQPR